MQWLASSKLTSRLLPRFNMPDNHKQAIQHALDSGAKVEIIPESAYYPLPSDAPSIFLVLEPMSPKEFYRGSL